VDTQETEMGKELIFDRHSNRTAVNKREMAFFNFKRIPVKRSIITGFFTSCILIVCTGAFAQLRIKVACIGDSITEGFGLPSDKTYPAILQKLMGSRYDVRNFGISGSTLLKKGDFPYWNEKKYKQALEWQPDLVIIKLGTNDSKPQNWKFGSEYERDYSDLLNSFRNLESHPAVYLCFPIPVFEDKWGITDSIVRNHIVGQVKMVARKAKSQEIDLYHPFLGKKYLCFDGVHPNTEGSALLANQVYRTVNKFRKTF
jgi:acyl-CoA thioesterase-1